MNREKVRRRAARAEGRKFPVVIKCQGVESAQSIRPNPSTERGKNEITSVVGGVTFSRSFDEIWFASAADRRNAGYSGEHYRLVSHIDLEKVGAAHRRWAEKKQAVKSASSVRLSV